MNNGRFATALHILTLLAQQPGEALTSEYMAGSINVNAVVVRKAVSSLKEHGFIQSKEGKGGGSILAKDPKEIRLSGIYQAVNQTPILGRTNSPNPVCLVGKQINHHLQSLYSEAEEALIKKLSQTTLADFTGKFF